MKKSNEELRKLLDEADLAISEILKDLNLGRIISKHIKATDIGLTLKLEVHYSDKPVSDKIYSQADINSGIVEPGTILWIRYPKWGWCEARILKTRRTKYMFEFVDKNPTRPYIADFTCFRLTNPEE